jgi:hypothetical protein
MTPLALLLAVLAADAGPINLAPAATPSTSHVSPWESLAAINNGYAPANCNDKSHGAYGNWPETGTQWVQYDWPQAVSVVGVEVYWFDDNQGVRLPTACRLKCWDGAAWRPVAGAEGLGLAANRFNTVRFAELTTPRLRLEFDGREKFSTGLLQWRVLDSGRSPHFPPRLTAGPDRDVMLGDRTWLNAVVLPAGRATPTVTWSKVSGPGQVTFENGAAAFSTPGVYELRATAVEAGLSATDSLRVTVRAAPPAGALEEAPLGRYSVSSQLWRARLKALIVNWVPHVVAKLNQPKLPEGGIDNFVEAGKKLAGQPHGDHIGPPWANAYTLNALESICAALLVDPQGDAEIAAAQSGLRANLEDWIPKILAAQEPDGWLHTQYTLRGGARWRNKGDHQGYIAGYFIEAALAHVALTEGRDPRLIDAARRLADCWCAHIGPSPKLAWYDGHEELEQALVRLADYVDRTDRPGAGDKYVALSKFLLACRGHGDSYDQSHLPLTQQYEALGHAVRAVYVYNGLTNVAARTGDLADWSAAMSLWDSFVNRKYYVTGGVGSGETAEGFGGDYSLPNSAYCESCAGCGAVFWQSSLQRAWRQAQFADLAEETLYNALLGSIDLDGHNFTYTNPLDSAERRYSWHGCPCCVGNIPRVLLSLPRWLYTKEAGNLYVNHYLGSTVAVGPVAGARVTVTQETDYPWQGHVALTLTPAAAQRFSLHLRLPSRGVSRLYKVAPAADGAANLKVNGQSVALTERDGYAVLDRLWQPGDRVELDLPLTVQRIHADPKIAADRGKVALRVGPLIYNFESVDQSLDGSLSPSAALTTEWRPELLGGVMVIKGHWGDGKPLLAVPNWARLNRGGRSVVWIREG